MFGPTWSELFGERGGRGRRPRPHAVVARPAARAAGARGRARRRSTSTTRATLRAARGSRCGRSPRVDRRLLRAQGEPPSRRAAGLPRRRARLRVRLGRRAGPRAGAVPRPRPRERLLFTPNFAPREEYRRGFEVGARVTRRQRPSAARVAGGLPRAASSSCASIPGGGAATTPTCAPPARSPSSAWRPSRSTRGRALLAACGARVVGLHAHAGSGVRDARDLERGGALPGRGRRALPRRARPRPRRRPRRAGAAGAEPRSTSTALGELLRRFKAAHPRFELWLEPGRFLVAQAGVLLARVTQIKRKGEVHYVGLETGMNSLIRPAALRRLPSDRQPHAARRAGRPGRPRRRPDLRDRRRPRPLAPPAADRARGTSC